jgi:cobalt/nickel transport system permease protein
MHIPDGYLSPQTYVPAYAVMIPIWMKASSMLKKTLRSSQTPMLALGAAFCFVIMMFNIPIPGGTTGHAVGAVLVAVLLGPWAAVVAVSLALILQAFIFGDGGVTAIGANCLNMAVIMPFTGWIVYKWIANNSPAKSPRRWVGAALGGYVGLNIAALAASIELGIQPLIAHDPSGKALYCPFGLKVAIPAMMIGHLTLFGLVEAITTGLVIAYLQQTDSSLIIKSLPEMVTSHRKKWIGKLTAGLVLLVLLTPLGLYIPSFFGANGAWGEWSASEISKEAKFVPQGLAKLNDIWKAPMQDYALPSQKDASLNILSLSYILSAVIGVISLTSGALIIRRYLIKKEKDEETPGVDASRESI